MYHENVGSDIDYLTIQHLLLTTQCFIIIPIFVHAFQIHRILNNIDLLGCFITVIICKVILYVYLK